MAGTDLEFTYDDDDDPLISMFVAATRRRARTAGIQTFRSSRIVVGGRRGYYISVDGRSWRFSLLAQKLERDLPLLAEAIELPHRSLRDRRRLANSFVTAYAHGGYGSDEDEEQVPHLRPMTHVGFQWVPHLITYPAAKHIDQRLAVTEKFCVDWYFGEIPGPTMLEELHTASELLLSHAVGDTENRGHFPGLVDRAASAGLLDRCVQLPTRGNLVARDRAQRLLQEMSDVRREVRHRGDPSAEAWLRTNFSALVYILETISEEVLLHSE